MSKIQYCITSNLDDTKNKLSEIIRHEFKKDYIKTSWNNHELCIRIEKVGASEIKIALTQEGDSVFLKESSRNISMMHKPFVSEVERRVHLVMEEKLGAKKV